MGSCIPSEKLDILPRKYKTMLVSLLCLSTLVSLVTPSSWHAAPYTLIREKRSPQQTKFFTGNTAVDAGAAGAALGLGAHYFANQLFNPCRSNGGVRKKTPTRKIPATEFLEDNLET